MELAHTEILDMLASTVETHCEFDAQIFHHGLEINKPSYDYVWGKYKHGYLLYSSHSAVFLDPMTGKAHKISRWWNPIYMDKHILLNELCDDCRIEIPIEHNTISVNNDLWEHKIVQRPNKELGIEYASDLLQNNNDMEHFNNYIGETTKILTHMSKVVDIMGDGLPTVQMRPTKMLRDSIGYFWIDFKQWDVPRKNYIEKNLACFSSTLRVWNHNFPNRIEIASLIERARKEWTIIPGY